MGMQIPRRTGEPIDGESTLSGVGFRKPATSDPMIYWMSDLMRANWTCLTDDQLLAQCEVDTYRASGPGGQKRNKTSSAVRLRHLPSGLLVIAEESRSQHENKAKALKRIQRALFLEIREPIPEADRTPEAMTRHPVWSEVQNDSGKVHLRAKHPHFWPVCGLILDLLVEMQARVSEVAEVLGISTGNLIELLEIDPKMWQQVNHLRVKLGQKPLRSSS